VKRIGAAALGLCVTAGGLVVAAHASPAFGAALADAVRAVVGTQAVAWAEDVTYDAADRLNSVVYADAAPKQFWDEAASAPRSVEPTSGEAHFSPLPFAPPFPKVAGKADGTWLPVPGGFFKTVIHPDEKRTFAAVAVVAIDLSQVELAMVAGTLEPASTLVPAAQRPGVVPPSALPNLVAAFNGGFKAEHGHYGMMVDRVVLLPTRERACTVAILDDGAVKIGAELDEATQLQVRSSRQTPPCLLTDGVVDDRTSDDNAKRWGAAVGGATVIRRSALGVSADGKTLFYGLGDSVTAGALARAMKAAGAEDAAQLDVNAAYPRFLFYSQDGGGPAVRDALIPGLAYGAQEYVATPEGRDFFYLSSRHALAPALAACVAPEGTPSAPTPATVARKAKGKCKGGKKCRRSELPADADEVAA
jgi:hypothetical protein